MCDQPEPNPELATSVSLRMTCPSEYNTGLVVEHWNSFFVDDIGAGRKLACSESPPPFGQSPLLHRGVTPIGGIGGTGFPPDDGTESIDSSDETMGLLLSDDSDDMDESDESDESDEPDVSDVGL